MREMLTEAAALNNLLGNLQLLAESHLSSSSVSSKGGGDALKSLEELGVFKECEELLTVVRRGLDACELVQGKDVKSFGHRLAWPFKERETKDAMQRLARLRGLLSMAVDANSA